MQKYTNVVQDNSGNVLTNVTVTVYLTATQTLATLYSNNAGLSKVNPFTNDTDGSKNSDGHAPGYKHSRFKPYQLY